MGVSGLGLLEGKSSIDDRPDLVLADHGIALPEDTVFVAGLHDTTTDAVTLYEDGPAGERAGALAQARRWLEAAAIRARAERALRLPGATAGTVARRADDWAETRPEWGLAGCAAFIAAPRGATARADLSGRAFLRMTTRDEPSAVAPASTRARKAGSSR